LAFLSDYSALFSALFASFFVFRNLVYDYGTHDFSETSFSLFRGKREKKQHATLPMQITDSLVGIGFRLQWPNRPCNSYPITLFETLERMYILRIYSA
jgi:hypothetical protein